MALAIRVSEAASIGMHVLAFLVSQRERNFPARELAQRLGVSEAHLAKVMQRLAKAGLVDSVRGPKGGFRLNAESEDTTLMEVFEAIDGPVNSTGCLFGSPVCDGRQCIMGDVIKSTDKKFQDYLDETTVSDLIGVYGGGASVSQGSH